MGHWRFCLDAIAAVRVVRILVALSLIVHWGSLGEHAAPYHN